MGRPSLITEEMEDFIRIELLKKPRPTANTIFKGLMDDLEGNGIEDTKVPGEDAVIKRITKLRKEVDAHPPSDLDSPWTIGACLEYNIPLTPTLLEIYQTGLQDTPLCPLLVETYRIKRDEVSTRLTIRQARWFTLLFPLLEPKIKVKCSELEPITQLGIVVFIAEQYANREQIAEITNHIPDTLLMDNKYFIKEDFSSVVAETYWMEAYTQLKSVELKKGKRKVRNEG